MSPTIRSSLNAQRGRIHPLIATAAGAVILVSLVGVAAITGVLPSSNSTVTPVSAMAAPIAAVAPATLITPATPPTVQPPVQPVAYQQTSQAPAYVAIPDPDPEPAKSAKPHKETAPKVVRQHSPSVIPDDRYSSQSSQHEQPYRTARAAAVCNSCGRVESVVAMNQPARGSGLGIAAGAVLGGVLGNQVGGGSGKTLATVAGAVAGGYGGNEVEKRVRSTTSYQVRVRMEDGEMRTFSQNGPDGFRVGDRVRVVNGALTSR